MVKDFESDEVDCVLDDVEFWRIWSEVMEACLNSQSFGFLMKSVFHFGFVGGVLV